MSQLEPEKQKTEIINIPLEWHTPDTIQSRYATNVLVQAGPNEVFVSFFEAQIPILTGTPEENADQLKHLSTIKAECVGKFIVSPELIPNIINALQTGLNTYRLSKEDK